MNDIFHQISYGIEGPKHLACKNMREFGDFIRIRAGKVGLKIVDQIMTAVPLSKQTAYTFLNAKTPADVEKSHSGNKESLASALKFSEWAELVGAYEANDLFRGLDNATAPPRPSVSPIGPTPTTPTVSDFGRAFLSLAKLSPLEQQRVIAEIAYETVDELARAFAEAAQARLKIDSSSEIGHGKQSKRAAKKMGPDAPPAKQNDE